MHKLILTAAASALVSVTFVPSAFAMSGIDAARSCESQKGRCKALFDDSGGVTILVDGYIIDCPSPQAQCEIVGRPARIKANAGVTSGALPGLEALARNAK